jgi:hypothetical protein
MYVLLFPTEELYIKYLKLITLAQKSDLAASINQLPASVFLIRIVLHLTK